MISAILMTALAGGLVAPLLTGGQTGECTDATGIVVAGVPYFSVIPMSSSDGVDVLRRACSTVQLLRVRALANTSTQQLLQNITIQDALCTGPSIEGTSVPFMTMAMLTEEQKICQPCTVQHEFSHTVNTSLH